MKALLRADVLRLRRRKDFWIIAIAVCLLGGISFLAGYRSEAQDPPPFNEAQYRQDTIDSGFLEGLPPEEATADLDALVAEARAGEAQQKIDWEAQQAIALQKYDIAQSPFTLLGPAIAPILALILIASLAIGDEFRFGTVRTSLLAAGSRRRFLGARLVSLLALTIALFGALVLLGVALGAVLRLTGAEVPASVTPIDPGAGLAWLGAQVLVTFVLILLGTALTVLLRSGALPLLLIIVAGLVEAFISALPVFGPQEFLAGVPQALLSTSIRALTTRLAVDTHAIALEGSQPPAAPIDLPIIAVAAIVAAWGVVFVVAADRRFRTMDIVE
jgi:ABC-type transport system involved in multi-copper enzyme maturation permease subunit